MVERLLTPAAQQQPPALRQRVLKGGVRLKLRVGPALSSLWAWKWFVAAAIASLSAAAYFGPTLILGPSVAGDRPTRGFFIQTVVASGHVEAPFRVNVGSQITGVVAAIPVSELRADIWRA